MRKNSSFEAINIIPVLVTSILLFLRKFALFVMNKTRNVLDKLEEAMELQNSTTDNIAMARNEIEDVNTIIEQVNMLTLANKFAFVWVRVKIKRGCILQRFSDDIETILLSHSIISSKVIIIISMYRCLYD